MSQEERNAFAGVITSFFVLGYFGNRIYARLMAGAYDGPDGLMIWARSVLGMMAISIGLTIAITIGFTILYAIVTNTPDPSTITDERDVEISKRGVVVTLVTLSAGLFIALGGAAFGWSALVTLNVILLGFAVGALFGDLSKLAAYRFAW